MGCLKDLPLSEFDRFWSGRVANWSSPAHKALGLHTQVARSSHTS